MEGMRKASVLPEPVRAAPRTSLPARRTGMDLAWTGVIVARPISERARVVGSERSKVEKGSRPGSVGLEAGFVGDFGEEDEEASFVASSVEDDFEGPGCSGCWAWDASFLFFLLFFLFGFVSAGADFVNIATLKGSGYNPREEVKCVFNKPKYLRLMKIRIGECRTTFTEV